MNNNISTLQRQHRFRRGMLCMYRERLQVCRDEFMAASAGGNAESMRAMTEEMKSLFEASLALITEAPNVRDHPHLTLLPRQ